MFIYTANLAFSEVDNFEQGCLIDTSQTHIDLGIKLEAETMPALIKAICRRYRVGTDCLLFNSCEEIGRLDVQLMSTKRTNFKDNSAANLTKWTSGEIDLFFVCIVGEVIERKLVDLSQY